MADRYHTVILVPHTRAKLRKFRVTNLGLAITLGSFLLLTAASGFVLWSQLSTTVEPSSLDSLRAENESLREVNQSFEQSLHRLREQLSGYEERTRKLAIVAGLENLGSSTGVGGAGTVGEYESFDSFLTSIEARASLLTPKLDQVESELEERRAWMASTPAIAPTKGLLTSNYGYRKDPFTNQRTFHPGLDISAPAGRPVVAPADGVVTRAGRIGGLGKAIYISHGYGVTTHYGHLSRIDVKPGQRVKRGAVIGAVGSTGRSTGNHLHYEVRHENQPTNPLTYILDRP